MSIQTKFLHDHFLIMMNKSLPQMWAGIQMRQEMQNWVAVVSAWDEWYSLLWDYDFVKKYQPSIAFLELYGVAIAILLWLCKFKNKRLFLHCDNMSVVYMLNKSTSNCKFCLMLIRLIVLECIKQNCTIQAQHVDMKSNRLADLLSRNKVKTFKAETKRRFKDYSLPIPETLWPMSKIWALA